ncbi:MAG: LysR family transcriptional regulator [Pseudomonadota bacterium]
MNDIRRLDPQLLLVFEALMDTESASLSAARLGLTQSTVSGALKRLRDIFEDTLFERRSHGLTPTQRAKELHHQVAEALDVLRRLTASKEFDPSQAQGTVTFLATDYAISTLLAPFRALLSDLAPNLRCVLKQYSSADASTATQLGAFDFIIGSAGMLPDNFGSTHLRSERLMLYMCHNHPCAKKPLQISDLDQHPHVLISLRDENPNTRLDEALAQHGARRTVDTVCPSFLSLPVLLRNATRFAVAPEGLQSLVSDSLLARELPVELPDIQLYAAWHPRFRHDQRHRWLRQILSDARGK